MPTIDLAGGLLLRSLTSADAFAMHRVLTQNRAHLDRWLRWSARIRSLAETEAFIEEFARKEAAGDGFHCGLWSGSALIGGVVCWYLNRLNRNCEVGYWLVEAALGRGLATRAVGAAVDHLVTAENVHRVEMQCGVTNARSRAVPERLGFQLEGIRRESHWVTDRFVDHAVYGLLATDRPRLSWNTTLAPQSTSTPTSHAG
jgi:ribosomal-protein-serine acetyltransferase